MDNRRQMTLLTRIDWCKYGFSNKSIDEIFEEIRTGDMLLNDTDLGSYTLRKITIIRKTKRATLSERNVPKLKRNDSPSQNEAYL